MEKAHSNGGEGLCTIQDGAGKKILTYAFAGSIINLPQNYSDTVEYDPKPEWSNGSDTMSIETHLRATKRKLDYIEVKEHQHGGKRKGAGRPLKMRLAI